jgi:hypothetical protein
MANRDYQKSKVYAWENKFIAPRCPRCISIEHAQCFVDGVFICEGLVGSPRVSLMPKQATKTFATGERTELRLRPKTPAWVILHELAHSLTEDFHGPNFVGVYLKLLDKYADLSLLTSMFSLQTEKIDFNLSAIPCFKDK